MHCKKYRKISIINFRLHLSCLQKFDLVAVQISLILQQTFYSMRAKIRACTLQVLGFDVSEKMPYGSNDVEEESSANSILIAPSRKKVLNALDKNWQHLQREGVDMDTSFVKKTITREHTKQH